MHLASPYHEYSLSAWYLHLSRAVLGRATSTAALLVRRGAIAANVWAVGFADLLVARAGVQAVLWASSLLLSSCLGLLWAGLFGVEGSVGVCGAIVGARLGVLGRPGLQRVFVLRIFLSEACWSCAEEARANDGCAREGCALYGACGLDAEHGEVAMGDGCWFPIELINGNY